MYIIYAYICLHTHTHTRKHIHTGTYICMSYTPFISLSCDHFTVWLHIFIDFFFQNTNRAGASVANSYPWKALELDKLAQVFFF